ncbi:conserved hypothetical protein [Candida albicans WO-1]|uniref:Cell wall mannoprotein PIR1-like C-terminal domain-containing protein n=1 Tax=Candida albicans (strain WO-1) TaxID=294748 RepID=C4YI03_CANAW|nr:conserved hypothetical protein [Candida albicans WO-1]
MILITINTCKYPIYSSSFFLYHHKTTTQLTTNHNMKFSTAALTLSLFAIVNSSVTTYGAGFGGDDDDNSKHHKYDCEIDTYEWKFALAVKEWKHCQDKKFCQDTNLDLVYEGDDGQLYHGCDGTYPYSKCKHCTNVFTGGDDDDDNCDDDCKKKKKKVYFAKRGDDDDDDKCDDKCEYPYCEIHNTDCDLLITLCGGVLTDDKHATGEIVANHQFQFDKPPQKDALHKKGFSIVHTEGTYYLALDHKIDFWHCKVDDKGLYKIYDKSIGEQCSKIKLIVLKSDEKATFTDDSDDCDDDCKKKQKETT